MSTSRDDSLPFEEPLRDLKKRIEELMSTTESDSSQQLLRQMVDQQNQYERELYENLSPWNTVQIARHPKRPQARDYLETTFDDYEELHGDRMFRDDLAIVTALATLGRHRVMFVGEHKGRDVNERHLCFAGCPHPEGYRKALRKMQFAEKMGLPVITLVDTKGAYPGIGSEERGVALAIAENLREMAFLRVPIICVIIGEGGSGGALGVCVGDRILMLRHAYYSVISPEGCASILWRDPEEKARAAEAMKITSRDLLGFELIDRIVEEPLGGAHRDPEAMAKNLREALIETLDALVDRPVDELIDERYEKYRRMGEFHENVDLSALQEEWAAEEAAKAAVAEAAKAAEEDGASDEADDADDASAETTAEAPAEADEETGDDATSEATESGEKEGA